MKVQKTVFIVEIDGSLKLNTAAYTSQDADRKWQESDERRWTQVTSKRILRFEGTHKQ